jgi:Periplasmic sensor domain
LGKYLGLEVVDTGENRHWDAKGELSGGLSRCIDQAKIDVCDSLHVCSWPEPDLHGIRSVRAGELPEVDGQQAYRGRGLTELGDGGLPGFHKKFAEQTLRTIRSERYVMAAVLYDKSGGIFAEYRRKGLGADFKTPEWREVGTTFDERSLTLHKDVLVDGAKAGSIAIVSDLSELQSTMRHWSRF